jgi:hypothetical protein
LAPEAIPGHFFASPPRGPQNTKTPSNLAVLQQCRTKNGHPTAPKLDRWRQTSFFVRQTQFGAADLCLASQELSLAPPI